MDGSGQSLPELLVDVRDLAVTYSPENGPPIRALDGVTLQIHPGEAVGILGESGCGKSTLASALLRSLPPHAAYGGGSMSFRGRDLLHLSHKDLRSIQGREISLISQDPALALNPVMTAGSQISEALRAHMPFGAQQRRDRVLELLREVGFDHPKEIRSAYPHQLSGGQRQRVAIAQAIACRPPFLIADEPTSKLDPTLQVEVVAFLRQIRRQLRMAILMISHDPALLAGFVDRIAVMYAGRIIEVGNTADIFGRPLHPYTQALVRLAASSIVMTSSGKIKLPSIAGDPPDSANIPAGCRFEPRCSDRMDVCSLRYPNPFTPEPSRPVNCFKYGE